MRQWWVDPRILCDNHLLGEHYEHHCFAGSISKGKNVSGYMINGLLDPNTLKYRHDYLVKEMLRRGFHHNSDMIEVDYSHLDLSLVTGDAGKSLDELLSRCKKCRWLYTQLLKRKQGIESIK